MHTTRLTDSANCPQANPQGAQRLRAVSKTVGALWLTAGFLLAVFWMTHPRPAGWDRLGHAIVTVWTLLGMMVAGGIGMLMELLRLRPCRVVGYDALVGIVIHAIPMLITIALLIMAYLLNW